MRLWLRSYGLRCDPKTNIVAFHSGNETGRQGMEEPLMPWALSGKFPDHFDHE